MPNSPVNAAKPRTAGSIFRAPAGTTLPTDASTALASAFKSLGYVSEDGVTNTHESDTTEIKEWGGKTVLVVKSGYTDEFQMTLLDTANLDLLKAVFGSEKVAQDTTSSDITISVAGISDDEAVYVIDMALNDGNMKRIVIPCGVISELGDVNYKADEAIAYELTINAKADSSGNNHYEYITQ